MAFVDASSIVQDPTTLLDNGIDFVNTTLTANGFPNWSPADADLAVIIMAVASQWAADNGQVAVVVSEAIFRNYGTQLWNIPYVTGAFATVTTTWTFTTAAPTAGYQILAGTGVVVDGQAFYVQTEVDAAMGATTATVTLVSAQIGAAYNGLGGVSVGSPRVVPVDQIDWVSGIVTTGLTAGGADQESDDDYQNRLAAVLQLAAPRPITAADYANMVLSLLAVEQTGVTVGRATSIDGWFPAPRALSTGGAGSTVLSCTTVNTSPTVTIVTSLTTTVPQIGATVTGTGVPGGTTVAATPPPTLTSFTLSAAATASATNNLTVGAMSGYGPVSLIGTGSVVSTSTAVTSLTGPYVGSIPAPGATVIGVGVPAAATVAPSPAPTATGFTLSAAATSSHAFEALTISEWTNVARCVTTFVTDANGNALSPVQMDALQTWLNTLREINFLSFVQAPSYTTVYVTAQIHVLPGFAAAAVVASVGAALVSYLSPATWGSTGLNAWLNYTQGYSIVRFNSVIGLIESVPGVQYAVSGQVFLGTSASPAGTSDITLSGPAPLPAADLTTPTIVVTAV